MFFSHKTVRVEIKGNVKIVAYLGMDEVTQKWLKEQRREDVIAEILYNGKKTSLSDLKKIGWTNGFPVSVQALLFTLGNKRIRLIM